jgi:hypothetical protein
MLAIAPSAATGTDSAPTSVARRRVLLALGSAAALTAVALLGLAALAYPFDADQSTFVLGAQVLAHGGMLYRNLWDLKPPGIFLFFLAAGNLFGFDARGIHAFELLYWLAFATTIILSLRTWFGDRTAVLAAVCTTATYYVMASWDWLTLLEPLVNFPLFVALIALARAAEQTRDTRRWLLVYGLASGCVAVFKLNLILIPLAFLPVFWWCAPAMARRRDLWLVGGVAMALPPLAIALWFALGGELSLLVNALLVFPAQVAASLGGADRLGVLSMGVRGFAVRAAPLLALAPIGLYRLFTLRGSTLGGRPSSVVVFLRWGLIAWMVAAAVDVLMQVMSWWDYQWMLVLFPLGFLSAVAMDWLVVLLGQPGRRRVMAIGAVLVALLATRATGSEIVRIARTFPERLGAIQAADPLPYQRSVSPGFDALVVDANYLRLQTAQKGPIFVFGPVILYQLTGRPPASAMPSYINQLTPGVAEQLMRDFRRSPPAYIYLDGVIRDLVLSRVLGLQDLLQQNYRLDYQSDRGAWYGLVGTHAEATWSTSAASPLPMRDQS